MADEQITSNTANIPFVNLINVGSDQAAPSAGRAILYIKGGVAYVRLDTGAPVAIGGAVALPEGRLAIGDGSGELSALALGTEGQLVTADASGFATWDDPPSAPAGGGGSGNIIILPFTYATKTGGTVTNVASMQDWLAFYTHFVPAAQNDELTFKVNLDAATYDLRLLHVRYTDKGIYTVAIDGTTVATLDGYGTVAHYVILTQTGISVATAGLKTLSVKMATKNASSTSYEMALCAILLNRTA